LFGHRRAGSSATYDSNLQVGESALDVCAKRADVSIKETGQGRQSARVVPGQPDSIPYGQHPVDLDEFFLGFQVAAESKRPGFSGDHYRTIERLA